MQVRFNYTPIFLALVLLLTASTAQSANTPSALRSINPRQSPTDSYSCSVVGQCEVCTDLEKKTQPYCKEFGNKQRISCQYNKDVSDISEPLPMFRGCPRVQWVERARYYQFVVINVIISLLAVGVFSWRHRKLAGEQYRKMAQRIGISV
ncbi:hypothetical protein K450DRAFT_253055 [Umbelopsis ramanniana AG]|uniref:Protein JTB n=1 Tax=Umbelopsis ramanniana AG TaxID=1314678 RepID=A0AAD5HAT4_UMBRA|nr:uncharacterized protein K450DRAFT_253055 [Umbelopsis ramanniana AG]KAI8577277.1 hypothetical protein K450DRAFT_253055 [Umbelopsis ramanniana AG]